MIFTCEKAILSAAISIASRATAIKSSIPAIEGILLQAGDLGLCLTGYNMETGIQVNVMASTVESGSIVLSARLFGEIVRKMPDDLVTFTTHELSVNVKCGSSQFNILGMDPHDFPELPSVEQQNSITLPQPTLRSMISETIFAVSDNENRPVHTGSLFDVAGDTLTLVSVDGYRLALRREKLKEKRGQDVFSFVVPGKALSEVEKICSDEEAEVTVIQGANHVLFRAGDTVLVSRRLEGDFLAYRNAIPRNNPIRITCDARSLLASLERVSLIISDKLKSPLRCVFNDGEVEMTASTSVGDAEDRCAVDGNGNGLEIGFNNRYLMDAVRVAPTDRLVLEFASSVAPCVILPAEGEENFIYMVLPVRLKAK